jgi:hypothetical protein
MILKDVVCSPKRHLMSLDYTALYLIANDVRISNLATNILVDLITL